MKFQPQGSYNHRFIYASFCFTCHFAGKKQQCSVFLQDNLLDVESFGQLMLSKKGHRKFRRTKSLALSTQYMYLEATLDGPVAGLKG